MLIPKFTRGLIGLSALLAFLVPLSLGLYFERSERIHVRQEIEARIRENAVLLAPHLELEATTLSRPRLLSSVQDLGRETGSRITLIAADGAVLADSDADPATMENHRDRPEVLQALAQGTGMSIRRSGTLGVKMIYFAYRIDTASETRPVLRLSVSTKRIEERLRPIRVRAMQASLAGALLSMFTVLFWSRRRARQLKELKATAIRAVSGETSVGVSRLANDEIEDLSRTIRHLAETLTRQMETNRTEAEKLSPMLAAMEEGILAIDPDHRVLFCNDVARRYLSVSGECVGRPIEEIARVSEIMDAMNRARETWANVKKEISIFQNDGESRVEIHAVPFGAPGDARVLLILHDVTEIRKQAQVRQDFVANASHELKTPLTAIKGYVDTLLEGADQDGKTRKRFLNQLAQNVDRLVTLTEDLLSLSRIESRRGPADSFIVDLGQAAEEAVKHYLPAAKKKRLTLAIDRKSSAMVRGEAHALREICDNLIDNAVKYTASGEIRVSVKAETDFVKLSVSDTGIGIPQEHLPRIFERFYRVDRARSIAAGGTGLGLAIVKHLVQELNGSIKVFSQVGKGSCFSVTLPITEPGS
ncbi:MAG TPA: ATP-binding protein [Bdellovibrionota bacterium]|nr:ATP-binding protein [Bdellovibrionota bacterium]